MSRNFTPPILAGLAAVVIGAGIIGFRRAHTANLVPNTTVARISEIDSSRTEQPNPSGAESLDWTIFRRRIEDIFANGYLTSLAIIQGVALGLLLSTTAMQWYRSSGLTHHVMVALQAVASFTAIVVVTHRYLLLTVMARWVPTIFDTLIPFSIGVGEIGLALLIGHFVAWWGATLAFAIAGMSSYSHSRLRAGPDSFGQLQVMYRRFRSVSSRAIAGLLFLTGISIAVGHVQANGV
jgi:hypothetical protein